MTTPDLGDPIESAIDGVRKQFADRDVAVVRDDDGTVVIVDEVAIGDQYEPNCTWLGFRITAAYPDADVYPHYIGRVTRADGSAHGSAVRAVKWQGRPALQLSRRSNGWNSSRDTAALKAAKVLAWLADQ